MSLACTPGYAFILGACEPCPAGTYSSYVYSRFCIPAPVGNYAPVVASTAYLPCNISVYPGAAICIHGDVYCDPGQYYNGQVCVSTPSGYYATYSYQAGVYYVCSPGSYSSENSPACTSVAAGYYLPRSASTEYDNLNRIPCSYSKSSGGAFCGSGNYSVPCSVTTPLSSGLNGPTGIAVDSIGRVFIADTKSHRIRRMSVSGLLFLVAGSGSATYADGVGAAASFNNPQAVAVDSTATIFVADTMNHRIRRINSANVAVSIAGSSNYGYVDGTAALFDQPGGITVDRFRSVYVADNNRLVRKITSQGVVSTLAGTLTSSMTYLDGTGTAAVFGSTDSLAVDFNCSVYVVDLQNHMIRKITSEGVVSTLAGSGSPAFVDGIGTAASLNYPFGITIDKRRTLYFTSTGYGLVRQLSTLGVVTTLAGSNPNTLDGVGTLASFYTPTGIGIDSNKNIYVADNYYSQIRKLTMHYAKCPDGQYYTSQYCNDAPAGYQVKSGEAIYYACPAGYYSSGKSTKCIAAPAGNFTPSPGLNGFYGCPYGTYSLGGASACTINSSPPTSFPTEYFAPKKFVFNWFIFTIMMCLIGALCLVVMMWYYCYKYCWNDESHHHNHHHHHQHQHQHQPVPSASRSGGAADFGIDGNAFSVPTATAVPASAAVSARPVAAPVVVGARPVSPAPPPPPSQRNATPAATSQRNATPAATSQRTAALPPTRNTPAPVGPSRAQSPPLPPRPAYQPLQVDNRIPVAQAVAVRPMNR